MSRSDLPIRARNYDGNSESTSSPTEHEGNTLSPTKVEKAHDFSKKHEIKHVSVTVPGGQKAKAPVKKKKVAPTLVSTFKCDICCERFALHT